MLFKNRTFCTLFAAATVLASFGAIRPHDEFVWSDDEANRFFAAKVDWPRNLDVVILGDSRTVFGVTPEVFADAAFDEPRAVGNFGFLGAGLRADYLDAAANHLNRNAARRVVIIGVTPRSMVSTVSWRDLYTESIRMGRVGRFLTTRIHPWFSSVRRLTLSEIRGYSANGKRPIIPIDFDWHQDGWISATHIDVDLSRSTSIKPPDEIIAPFEPTTENDLLARVKTWTESGIVVFGFRPPVDEEIRKKENEVYRFDESFYDRFQARGGIWLNGDIQNLDCWDGSHLSTESAIDLSKSLGRQVRDHLK